MEVKHGLYTNIKFEKLSTIQQRHPQPSFKMKWDHFVSNKEVLNRAGVEGIEMKLVGNHLCWLGHICRMEDDRTIKALSHSQLFHGSQPVG